MSQLFGLQHRGDGVFDSLYHVHIKSYGTPLSLKEGFHEKYQLATGQYCSIIKESGYSVMDRVGVDVPRRGK